MKRRIHNLKFRVKITLIFGILFMIIMGVGGTLYYRYMARNLEESSKSSAKEVARQLYDTMESRIEVIEDRVHAMLINNTFVTTLANYLIQPDEERVAVTLGTVADFLKNLELGERVIHSAYIYTEEAEFDDFTLYRNWEFQFSSSIFYKAFQGNQEGKKWFYAMKDPIFQTEEWVVPCVWRFRVLGYPKDCYLVVQYRKKELDRILEGKEHFFDQILMVNGEGRRIAGNGSFEISAIEESGFFKKEFTDNCMEKSDLVNLNGEYYMAVYRWMPKTNWIIWCLKSQQSLFDHLKEIRRITIAIAGSLCIICLVITWILARSITKSLSRLTKSMNCVRNGDLEARFFYPYRDEVGSLAKSFNYMTTEMKKLVSSQEKTIEELKRERDHVAEIQKQKRKAELKALQAQINPHFLYNTLNAITWQAADQGANDIARLSNLLGRFFRLTLQKGTEMITLCKEAEHVKSYLDIQRIRYRSKIQYEIHIPEYVMKASVIKLILQPLVENSIYHGIKEKNGTGIIRIEAVIEKNGETEVLKITVWDDGVGMDDEKVKIINQGLRAGITDQREGYGIYNVNERIMLYYGKQYGLHFESVQGKWTRVVVTIPYCEKVIEEEI